MASSRAQVEKELKESFDLVDKDKSGFIDASEVQQILQQYYQGKAKKPDPAKLQSEISAFVKELDKDSDSKVSFKEFVDFVMQFVS